MKANIKKENTEQKSKSSYAYHEEEVSYINKDSNLIIAATLTLPDCKKKSPAVILISGMGPNDRDYIMLGHKLFLVLADHLTKKGIAVLRFDKRGVGKSEGTYNLTLTSKDFASDVQAGVAYLKTRKEIDAKQIGLIGHSEGGMIAPMVAQKSSDVSFLILMAPATIINVDDAIEQISMQLRADGATEEMIALDKNIRRELLEIIKQEPNHDVAEKRLNEAIHNYLADLPKNQKSESEKFLFTINEINRDDMITMFNSSWYRYFINHNPVEVLNKIKIPVLVINGDLDFITASKIALPIIAQALKQAKHKDYTIIEMPNLNHWFQTCQTGSLMEYETIKKTMSPLALHTMSDWILKRTK